MKYIYTCFVIIFSLIIITSSTSVSEQIGRPSDETSNLKTQLISITQNSSNIIKNEEQSEKHSGRYWGLRNLDLSISDDEYLKYNPQYIAVGTSWNRLENPDNRWNWSSIDALIEFAERHNCQVILVLEPESAWASDNEARAPNDLDRITDLEEVPERGFTEALYDYAYSLVERFMQANPNILKYIRYAGEPQYYNLDPPHWIATKETYKQDVEDYLRCLRTVYKAAHKAADDYDGTIKVSHGGFYYDDQLLRNWYEYGETHQESRDSIIQLFRSRYERHWQQTADSWEDIERRVNRDSDIPPCYWMDVIAGQTEWLDFFDVHHHWKPRFIFDELAAFEEQVLDSGGTLKPWFSAETAFQLNPTADTKYDARFHAADMVRKWILGIVFGLEGTCTPILGQPPEKFFGLYDEDGNEYLSAQSYRFIHSLIQPENEPKNLSTDNINVFSFNEDDNIIDVVWYDALFDADNSTHAYLLQKPSDSSEASLYDIFGNRIEVNNPAIWEVSQEPIIIKWDASASTVDLAKYEPNDGFVYHGVGWNYRNSVQNYLEMMPEDEQPLLFQTMSAIPGTRELTVSKVISGLEYEYMDIDSQFVEYGVHFQKTQDEPYDSIFAFTDELDHYIDTLAEGFKSHGKPFFLRIGGEMNGSWNNYTPYIFPKAFRKLVLGLRERGVDNFATVWCYEPAAPADFADSTELGWKWYPGDDVVDWFGLDVFPLRDFGPDEPDTNRNDGSLSSKGKSELFLEWAREKGFPVYINETTCHSENVVPDNEDPGFVKGEEIWKHWFVPFFQFLNNHPEIKAFNYINLDWTPIEKWSHWGDCRLEINSYIRDKWKEELSKSRYLHKGFNIASANQSSEFKIHYPNGGEELISGREYNILWTGADFELLRIDFTTDGGTNWNLIETDVNATANTYKWTIPELTSSECLIKLSDSENPETFDVSDSYFSIVGAIEKSLTLISPNGGEEWEMGKEYAIVWEQENVDTIKIEYSINNGRAWTEIVNMTSAEARSYNWAIPQTGTNNCLVKIIDIQNNSINDISDNTFKIVRSVSVDEDVKKSIAISLTYPNPLEDKLFFKDDAFIGKQYEIYSFLGKKVLEGINSQNTIDVSMLSRGIYLIRINNEFFNIIKK